MDVQIIFIEFSESGVASWFTASPEEIPVTFAELNGSVGFRKKYPFILKPIQGDVNEWQRTHLFNSVHFLTAIGKE